MPPLLKQYKQHYSMFSVPRSVDGGCTRLAGVPPACFLANGPSCCPLCAAGVQPEPRGQRSHKSHKDADTNQSTALSTNFINPVCPRRASHHTASSSSLVRNTDHSICRKNGQECRLKLVYVPVVMREPFYLMDVNHSDENEF